MLDWLDKIPIYVLVVATVLMGLAPFFPEPHLVEKLRMLKNGELKKPLDIFDMFYHLIPLILLSIRLIRNMGKG